LEKTGTFAFNLPPGYYDEPAKSYPIIFFLHVWSQRYFGGTRTRGAEEVVISDVEKIANFTALSDVFFVRSDGYNRNPWEE